MSVSTQINQISMSKDIQGQFRLGKGSGFIHTQDISAPRSCMALNDDDFSLAMIMEPLFFAGRDDHGSISGVNQHQHSGANTCFQPVAVCPSHWRETH